MTSAVIDLSGVREGRLDNGLKRGGRDRGPIVA